MHQIDTMAKYLLLLLFSIECGCPTHLARMATVKARTNTTLRQSIAALSRSHADSFISRLASQIREKNTYKSERQGHTEIN